VVEQRQNNVGFPQGTILKRHRVPLPAPNDDRFYTYDQFNVGTEVSLYGRVYKLIDCDPFTRNFLTKLGVRVPPGKHVHCYTFVYHLLSSSRLFGTRRSIYQESSTSK
jgi:hypothetical protein